jgi:hypothetical protein
MMGYGLRTDGSVHAHQLKSLDWAARQVSPVDAIDDTPHSIKRCVCSKVLNKRTYSRFVQLIDHFPASGHALRDQVVAI